MGEYAAPGEAVDGAGIRVAVVVSRFNPDITGPLLEGTRRALAVRGVVDDDVTVAWVPGAFELPLVAKVLAGSGACDAVVCLGAVIRGDTPHFDYVAGEAARGLQEAALSTGVPVVFGVLTTDTRQQALDRVGGSEGHKGEEAALTALEMVALLRHLPRQRD
ncbi:MAG: 6,7-dimethyl-8-ribityllumazine synthase [Actinobacteria bacterium]|nr:6,7-dimethyl-8-ribityllumazine synthase [Actinomycetota bacterium]